MELIKKIKEAESQAQQIVEQAGIEAAKRAEKNRLHRLEVLAQVEQERKKAIESAVSAAQAQGAVEVKALKSQAEKTRKQLRSKVAGKMAAASAKIIDYLRA